MRTATESLFNEPDQSSVRVKVCGLTCGEEAVACLQAGADWIGLNFHAGSPRFVHPSQAREIIAAVATPRQVVGLFVNRPAAEIIEIADNLGLVCIQLHGDEPPEVLPLLSRFRIIRAFRLGQVSHIVNMVRYLEHCQAVGRSPDAVLVDAYSPGRRGGTATLVGEDILAEIPPLPRLILAGGLTPGNVAERIARVRPWMVDVASGVESSPGRKDPGKVAAFLEAVRGTPER